MTNPEPSNLSDSPQWGSTTKLVVGLTFVAIIAALLVRFQALLGPLILAFMLTYLLHPVVKSLSNATPLSWRMAVNLVFIVLVIVLAFNFTGYLLPWDQLAYWASTVSTSLLGYVPYIGQELSRFIMGGAIIGQGTLRNFYAIHVAALPILMIVTLGYHFWKIRKNGGISQPESEERIQKEKRKGCSFR